MAIEWNSAQLGLLTQLWNEGMRTSVIAARLKTTKNSIVGKAHRIGLTGRPNPIKRAYPGMGPPKKAYRPAKPVDAIVIAMPMDRAQRALTLASQNSPVSADRPCQWPMWANDTPMHEREFCGKPSIVGSAYPWCPLHNAVGTVATKKKDGTGNG